MKTFLALQQKFTVWNYVTIDYPSDGGGHEGKDRSFTGIQGYLILFSLCKVSIKT